MHEIDRLVCLLMCNEEVEATEERRSRKPRHGFRAKHRPCAGAIVIKL